ncbi:MAG: fructosamine kinase family protein [Balneolaceae bacterium]|nr:fructosamine kinase family protein [Balneolaceae bacterium]MCH8548792.1 fructosamine kinase family protein [Balneolaceae bacterium]
MNLPDKLTQFLKSEHNQTIQSSTPIGGGSINQAAMIVTDQGELFLKWNSNAPPDFFEKEAEGLRILGDASVTIRIPEVILSESPAGDRPGFLLMEYIDEGSSGDPFKFGADLADLHKNNSDQFGLFTDNYIGSLPQSNSQHSEWSDFFAEERIKPQLKMAIDSGKLDSGITRSWERLAAKLDDNFPFTDPSLIHGDLWSGNYLYDSSGRAVLIDPAVYYGHPEMDLAFSRMFGGFPSSFYSGYESVSPLEPGFEERIPIYNLYPLLVHVNLFGGHYCSQVEGVLMRF